MHSRRTLLAVNVPVTGALGPVVHSSSVVVRCNAEGIEVRTFLQFFALLLFRNLSDFFTITFVLRGWFVHLACLLVPLAVMCNSTTVHSYCRKISEFLLPLPQGHAANVCLCL